MEGKLIKTEVGYHLWLNPETKEQEHIASNYEIVNDNGADLRKYKLSTKNCQAIVNGYDLDELAKNEFSVDKYQQDWAFRRMGFIEGFKTAQSLNDKMFSLDDMKKAIEFFKTYQIATNRDIFDKDIYTYLQSLQQTSWDVEIVELCLVPSCGGVFSKGECITTGLPLLDADGCLILWRVV